MSKGKRKARLRDYSYVRISSEARKALTSVAESFQEHPIVTAIMGLAVIEIELDELLRHRFKRNDDTTWDMLLDDRGPLGTLYAKIIAGYAFGIFDAKIADDLHRVRRIRNAFAHSKKIIHFNDDLVIAEMLPAHSLSKAQRRALSIKNLPADFPRGTYISLCFALASKLIMRQNRRLYARTRRLESKRAKLLASLKSQLSNPLSNPQLIQGRRSDDPSPSEVLGWLSGAIPEPSKNDDKKDK